MVTAVTEESSNLPRLVTVIDRQVSSWPNVVRSSLTDKASAVLGTKHSIVVILRDPELLFDRFPSCWAVIQWFP